MGGAAIGIEQVFLCVGAAVKRFGGHAMFDLNRYTVDRLSAAGVTAEALYRCTYAEEDLFYSYRRATHRSEPDYGRHVSAIVLEHI